jgi:hypothetical protein
MGRRRHCSILPQQHHTSCTVAPDGPFPQAHAFCKAVTGFKVVDFNSICGDMLHGAAVTEGAS